jgi:hypothetical protein
MNEGRGFSFDRGIYINISIHVYAFYAFIYACLNVYIYTYMRIHIYVYIYVYTHICKYMYIYTYIYVGLKTEKSNPILETIASVDDSSHTLKKVDQSNRDLYQIMEIGGVPTMMPKEENGDLMKQASVISIQKVTIDSRICR